ncbi:MAG: DUF3592 domain-containing protein [Tyzzerella sp.]|nr:DUF3592 domain-containing protein [Tyzzerella sp.]
MKKGILFKIILRSVGIFILLLGIRMIGEGIYNYIDEHHQEDWITIYAEVSDISSEYSSSSTKHRSSVSYDITYQYEVDGQEYLDMLYNRGKPMALGDKVKIKYDPDAPENSTDILSPSFHNLILFLVFGTIFATIGFYTSGAYMLIRRIRRRGKPEEEEVLPPEEYVDPKTIKRVPSKWSKNIFVRLLLFALVVGGILLSNKFFPGTQATDIEEFKSVVEKKGYVTTDSTEKLRQEWRVGSMMEEAISFDDGNVRMDFCVMDTADSAASLYAGMTLPLFEGEEKEQSGMIHEIHSIENSSMYVAKVRIRDTVLYVSALEEYKADAIGILKTIGYWKE